MQTLISVLSFIGIACGAMAMEIPHSGSSGHRQQHVDTPYSRIFRAAGAIVSYPNSWRANSEQLAVFVTSAIDLGWSDQQEIRDFKAAALDLTVFGTKWVDKLTDSEESALRVELNKLRFEAGVHELGGGPNTGTLTVDSQTLEHRLADAVLQTTGKLSKEQSEEFGKLVPARRST